MRQKEEMDIDRIVGLRLKEIRISKKISQKELGNILGVSFQQIQKYESGENKLSIGKYLQICKYFGVNLLAFSYEETELLFKAKKLLKSSVFKDFATTKTTKEQNIEFKFS